ncbi:MAG: peptidylprolyl isomerase [Spirochaetales bacterium]|nr:peptidylprolyl isomerase [Spirochaetales bacterium]
MKRLVPFSICVFLIAGISSAQIIDRPAATVNLTKPEFISVKQLEQRLVQYKELASKGISGIPTDPMVVLDSMIQELLLKQAAEESNVFISDQMVDAQIGAVRGRLDQQNGSPVTDAQFQELVLRETGLGFVAYRAQIKEQLLTQEYIKVEKRDLFDNIDTPSEREVVDQYRKNATSFTNPEMVRLSEIYIDTRNLSSVEKQKARERAEDALRRIENGQGTFSEMVLQFSDDTKSRYNEGDRGFFALNDPRIQIYGATYFDEIFALNAGEISKVLESRVGYHIVKITDHRNAKILQLDDPINPLEKTTVREFIQNLIMQDTQSKVLQKAVKELSGELRQKAEIRVFEDNIRN